MKTEPAVPGERTITQANAPRSFAVRVQRVLAVALVLTVGAAMLLCYLLIVV